MMPAERLIKSETQFPIAKQILDELGRQMPFLLATTMNAGCAPIESRLPALELIGQRLSSMHQSKPGWIADCVKNYVVLSLEFLKLQRELEKSGRYLLATEREARERAYHNEGVYGGYYLSGLLLSEALWPNHHRLYEAFSKTFLPLLPDNGKIIEVGVGTGYHLYHLY